MNKTLTFALIAAALIGVIYVFTKKKTTALPIGYYGPSVQPASSGAIGTGLAILSSVGNNIEGLLGVTPQGGVNYSSYQSPPSYGGNPTSTLNFSSPNLFVGPMQAGASIGFPTPDDSTDYFLDNSGAEF